MSVGPLGNGRLVAAAVGAATVGLRLPRAFSSSFWQDEVASARILREPTFGGMLHHVERTESTPPLWYALGWLTHAAGVSIHDTRLISVACDGLLAAGVVLLAWRVVPPVLATVAGVLVAVGGQLSAHGRELRAYELLALLALLFALALASAARRPGFGPLLSLGVVTTAGGLTHYFFFFTAAAGVAWLWLGDVPRAARARASATVALGLAACAVWLPQFLVQYRNDRYGWIGAFKLRVVLSTPLRLFTPLLDGGAQRAAALFVLGALGGGVVLLWRRGGDASLVAALAVGPLVLSGLVWLAGVRVYATRNLVEMAPFTAIALVAALGALPRRAAASGAAALAVLAVGAYGLNQLRPTTQYAQVAHALVAAGWQPGDPVAVFGGFYAYRSPLEWYLPHAPTFVHGSTRTAMRSVLFVVGPGHRVERIRVDGPVDRDRRLRLATILTPARVPARPGPPAGRASAAPTRRAGRARDGDAPPVPRATRRRAST